MQTLAGSFSRQRLIRGLAATAVGPITTTVVQVVSVPVFLHFWGAKLYGEWLILSAIPSYLSLSDMGFGSVAGNDMTMRVAAGDRRGALQTFQSTWVIVTAISALLAILAALVLQFEPVAAWFRIALITPREARLILALLTGEVLLNLQSSLAVSAFRCEGLYAVGTFWLNFTRFAAYAAGTAVVFWGASPVGVAVAFCVVRGAGTLWMMALLRVRIRWIRLGVSHANQETIGKLVGPAIAFMAFPAGNAISVQGMLIVIGLLLNPISVVIFSTLRTLTRFATTLMGLINNTVWPELSIAYGTGRAAQARQMHRRACQLSLWLAFASVAGLAIFGPAVYTSWTRGSVPMDSTLFHLLLLVVIANSFWYTSSVASVACNAHQRIATFYLGGAVASIALSYIFMPYFGLNACAIALLAIDLAMVVVVLRNSVRILGDNLPGLLRSTVSVPPVISIARSLVEAVWH